ncbi:MAG TPA: histidine kinase [Longimicrobium sp.]|nr:histidine kinase [Longimicrobium sp.]
MHDLTGSLTRGTPGWRGPAAVWAAVVLLSIIQEAMLRLDAGVAVGWARLVVDNAVEWASWGLLAPVVLLLVRRWPPRLHPATVAAYLLAGCAVHVANVVLMALGRFLRPWHAPGESFASLLRLNLTRLFASDLLLFGIIVTAGVAWRLHREARDREMASARLAASLSEARLHALTMQIQPHFVFNTLHAIAQLVRESPAAAEQMTVQLGDLLRASVYGGATPRVPLRDELALLEAYLAIQTLRFGDRLRVRMGVDDAVRDSLVPRFVLQPLVENAVRHGAERSASATTVTVSARGEGAWLALEVRDDGAGPATPDGLSREGVGIGNVRLRLEQMYGPRHTFALRETRPGVAASIRIPLERAAASVPAESAEAA